MVRRVLTPEEHILRGTVQKKKGETSTRANILHTLQACVGSMYYKQLNERAKTIYRETAKLLLKTEALAATDLAQLANFARWQDIALQAGEEIDAHGIRIVTNEGVVKNPSLSTLKAATDSVTAIGKKLGLSIADRQAIPAPPKANKYPDLSGPNPRAFVDLEKNYGT